MADTKRWEPRALSWSIQLHKATTHQDVWLSSASRWHVACRCWAACSNLKIAMRNEVFCVPLPDSPVAAVQMLADLGLSVYVEDFEKPFLTATSEFYMVSACQCF